MHSSFKHMLQQQLKKLGVTRDGGPQHGYDACHVAVVLSVVKISLVIRCS